MKQLVSKYYPVMVGVFLLAVIGGGGWLLWSGPTVNTSLAQESPPATTYEPLDAVSASRVSRFRADLGLDDDALVGLNLSATQIEQALDQCRTAAVTLHAEIHALRVVIGGKESALRNARRRIRIGPRDDALIASLPALQQDIATAKAAYQTYLDTIRTQVAAAFTATQAARWPVFRANAGERMPERMLSLSDGDRQALHRARRHYRLRLAQAADAGTREAAKTTYDTERSTILGTNNLQIIADYATNAPAASERVVEQVQKVLAVEDETVAAGA